MSVLPIGKRPLIPWPPPFYMSKDGDRGPQLLLTLCMSEKDGVVQEAL